MFFHQSHSLLFYLKGRNGPEPICVEDNTQINSNIFQEDLILQVFKLISAEKYGCQTEIILHIAPGILVEQVKSHQRTETQTRIRELSISTNFCSSPPASPALIHILWPNISAQKLLARAGVKHKDKFLSNFSPSSSL